MKGIRNAARPLIAAVLIVTSLAVTPALADGASITVTPSTGLADSQTVLVSGTGFVFPITIELSQCITPATACKPLGTATQSSGNFSTIAVVSRTYDPGSPPGAVVDCLTFQCEVRAIQPSGPDTIRAFAPIGFAAPSQPSGSPSPVPTAGPTGQRLAAVKRCRKKFPKGSDKRRKCIRRARLLPE